MRAWFTLGAWFGVLLMFVGVVLLVLTLVKSASQTEGERVLTPVVSFLKYEARDIFYHRLSIPPSFVSLAVIAGGTYCS